jgi:hypothetical protein
MEDFVDCDDINYKLEYLQKKVEELEKKNQKSVIKSVYDTSNDIYKIAYNAYIISKLSVPFWIFLKFYFKF